MGQGFSSSRCKPFYGNGKIVEESRRLFVAGVHLIPDAGDVLRFDITADEGSLP